MKGLSSRCGNIVSSPTLVLDAMAKAMIRDGVDVINLSVGEPDIPTPRAALDEAAAAMKEGFTRYTEVAGIEPLRRAVADRAARFLKLGYAPSQVVISNGGKHALFNIFMALLDPGDEVIIPAPYWVSYPEQVKLAGGHPVIYEGREAEGFGIDEARLNALVTARTKAILVNSPGNPTGAVLGVDDLRKVARIARTHDLHIISDEIYDALTFLPEGHRSIAQLDQDAFERTIIVNGWSKSYGMTGWRLGYTLSSQVLANAMKEIQGHVTSNVCSVAQRAALGAISRDLTDEARASFERRRDILFGALTSMPGIHCSLPEGAFYAFPNLKGLTGRRCRGRPVDTVDDVCDILLREFRVSIVPGRGFGASDNARISYAVSEDRLHEAIKRMHIFIRQLSAA